MSTQHLVLPEQALLLSFPELARNIRENLDEARSNRSHRLDVDVLRKLINLLDDKLHGALTKIPPRPKSLPVPVKPLSRKLPHLRNPKTPDYQRCQTEFDARINALKRQKLRCPVEKRTELDERITALRQEKNTILTRISLNYASQDFRDNWNAIRTEHAAYNYRMIEYHKQLREHPKAVRSILAAQAQWDLRYAGTIGTPETRKRIYDHLRVDAAAYLRGDLSSVAERLPWRFLPPGPNGIAQVAKEIRELKTRYPYLRYDEKRLDYAQTLNPSHTYVGNDEFEGYFAFVFDRTEHVLLENPQEGNAAYIFKRNWTALSKLPKRDLLEGYRHDVQRVLHRDSGNWKRHIRFALRIM
jgi:hypothetical protein